MRRIQSAAVLILLAGWAVFAGTSCSLPGKAATTSPKLIEWNDFVMVRGITYISSYAGKSRSLQPSDLGAEYDSVRFKTYKKVTDTNYRSRDGDAAFLEPGTKILEVKGYRPQFRLAAELGDRIVLYEAQTNPQAKVGADLLDLANKVSSILIGREGDGPVPVEISDPEQVANMVTLVESAQVASDPTSPLPTETRYMVTFRFRDGTSTMRIFWMESGILEAGTGLRLSDAFRVIVKGHMR